nr:hypothetical protein Iba_chr10cCG8710 [Ipomoea batatas]
MGKGLCRAVFEYGWCALQQASEPSKKGLAVDVFCGNGGYNNAKPNSGIGSPGALKLSLSVKANVQKLLLNQVADRIKGDTAPSQTLFGITMLEKSGETVVCQAVRLSIFTFSSYKASALLRISSEACVG